MRGFLLVTVAGAFLMAASVCWAGIPHLIHYQGMLTDDEGNPLNTPQDLTFRIYDDSTGGNLKWAETQYGISVTSGLFNVNLGDSAAIDLPFDQDYWLEIEVGILGPLSPRTRLTSVGYAYRADTAEYALLATTDDDWDIDTAGLNIYRLTGNVGIGLTIPEYKLDVDGTVQMIGFKMPTGSSDGYVLTSDASGVGTWETLPGGDDSVWIFRITDTADSTLMTGGEWGIARYGNGLYGNADSTHVNLGVACTTGASGQDYKYCTIGGGHRNFASQSAATVAGGHYNTASGYYATVGGGIGATASGNEATVGGGEGNTASGYASFIGGGDMNTASGSHATVGGGSFNAASGRCATVPGGSYDTASGDYSFAAGLRAKANHHGTFVWADSTDADFASTGDNQFLIRASGGIGIGTTSPQGALDVSSTTGAFIVPRMTTTQRDALTPVNGMIIYNTTDNKFNFYENGSWVAKQNE